MTSDVLEPRQTRIELSLAEENLVEQLRNIILKLSNMVRDINSILDDIFNDMFESAKLKVPRLLALYREICEDNRRTKLYLARISIGLQNSKYYLEIINETINILESLYIVTTAISAIIKQNAVVKESSILYLQKIMMLLSNLLNDYAELLKMLIGAPSKFLEISDRGIKTLNEIRDIFEGLFPDILSGEDRNLVQIIALIAQELRFIIRSSTNILEDLQCLQIMKQI
ncbi:hypothetical protein Igag_1377 [Ignisphaera aggregans DSM 17230]|uniref:Phosphate uptake regulator PhoU n=1 Tax=Ignisphaera aggregans (strain DSM 17230 / JCM 13409 / AQ1.S1) TaxID=583356 RepID=E0SQ49_IGNAA|nr:hypothetical protein Igag_1377 [Ignisphaera aggregans DSM 17230]